MSDWLEDQKLLNEFRREERAASCDSGSMEIQALPYSVKRITEYHFRVSDRLDLYPTRRRWHDRSTGKRGGYTSAQEIAEQVLGKRS